MAAGTDAKASGAAVICADDKPMDTVNKGKRCDERTDHTTNACGPMLPTTVAASSAPDSSAAGMFGRIASCAKQSVSWVGAPDGVVILCVSALAVVAICDSTDLQKHTRGGGVRHGGGHSSGYRPGHVPITDVTWGVSPAIFEWAAQLVPVFFLAAAGFEATVATRHRKATGHPPLWPLLVSGLTLHLAVHAAVSVASSPRGRASRDATAMTVVANRPEEAEVSMSWHVAAMRVIITSLTYPACIALVVRPLQRAMLNAEQQGMPGLLGNPAVMVLVSLFCATSLGLTAFGPVLFTVLVDSGIAFATCGAAIAGARLAGEGNEDNDMGSCPLLRQQSGAPAAATVDKRKRVWVGIIVGCGLLLTLSCMVEVWAGWKGSVASLTCIVAAAALVLQFGGCVLVREPYGRVESAQSVSTGTSRIHSRHRNAALGTVVCGIIVSPLLKVLLKRQSAMTWMSSTVTFVWYDAPLIILWYGICIGPLAVFAYHCTSAGTTALVAVARRMYQLRDDIRHWMALPAEPPPAVLVPWLQRGKTCFSSLFHIARGAVRKGRRFLARWLPAMIVVSSAALVLWVHLRSLPLVSGRAHFVSAKSTVTVRSQPVANPMGNGSRTTTHTVASRANFPSTNPPVYVQLGYLLWQCLWFAAAVLPLPHLGCSLCRHVLSAVGRRSGGIPALDSDAALFDDDFVHRVPVQQSETKHDHAAQVDPTVSSSIRAVQSSRAAARPGMMTTGDATFIDGGNSTRAAFTHVLFFRIHVGGLVEAGGSGAGNQIILGHVAAALDHLLEVLGTCLRPNKWKVELVTSMDSYLSLAGLVSSMAPKRQNRLAQACGAGQVVHLASSSNAIRGSNSSDDRTDISTMDLWRAGEAFSSAMADDWVVHLPVGCRIDTGFVWSVYDRAAAQHLHRSTPEIAVTAAVHGSGGISLRVRTEGGDDGDAGDDLDFATPAQCIVAHAQTAHAADYFGYLRGKVRAYGHLVGAASPRGLPVEREGRGGDSNAGEAEAVHRTVLGLTPDGFIVPLKDTLYGDAAVTELTRREAQRVTARSALGRALSTACPADGDLVTAMSTATLRGLLRSALGGKGASLFASGGCGTVVPLLFSGTRVGGAGEINAVNTTMWAHRASGRLGGDDGGRRSHTNTVPALLSEAVVRGIRMSWLDALVVNHDVKSVRSFWKTRYDAYESWWSAGDHLYGSIRGAGGGDGDSGSGGSSGDGCYDTAATGITRMVWWRWRFAVAHQALLPCSFALLLFGGAISRWIGSGAGGEGCWGGVFGPTHMIGTMTCALHVWRYAFGWMCGFRLSTQGVVSTGLILARHVAVLPAVVVFEAAVALQWIFQRALMRVVVAVGACSRRRGWVELRCGGDGGGEVEVTQDAVLSPA